MKMLPKDIQLANEYTYSRKFIDRYIEKAITSCEDTMKKVAHGVELLEEYRSKTYSYESKNVRMQSIQHLELEPLVISILVGVAYCQSPELFTSITAQLAGRLRFSEKVDGIKTIAEMVAVLCNTDAFDILKPDKFASLAIQSNIPLDDRLLGYIQNSTYLPPMVCEPRTLTNNYSSGYLTHEDSLILGKGNHHDENICLDTLNIANSVALTLNTEFLSTFEEEPTYELDTPTKEVLWDQYKRQSYKYYTMIAKQNNRFYLTHKVDKRGRTYAQGYHISSQGTSFKKACIELADGEVVTGEF